MDYKLIDFNFFNDKDSVLVALQNNVNCPFEIKRVFYIFDVPSIATRGNHANKDSAFLMIALKGSCKVKIDDAKTSQIITLDSPKQGLYLGKMLWKQMYDFSKDCVLLVLSDCYYNKQEYINDYNEFCLLVRGGGIIVDICTLKVA
ncbi:WxcM-like domain-containing protein [Helicobacter sp. MIT 11-5569]|uniref:sugar 3,4-ketoisomerase n=1 Tax=Helicobacter sp. MIT 11-5569 TaxID=1548151 RepID=UPI00051FA270|nr:FdtA/QdtA family cupin domain-containing protein [Helicobacter sp. MIT 11-5569]TLD81158.1 WxcM-like domain-containing protein [Helicobacter sp. MIT 11-5569]